MGPEAVEAVHQRCRRPYLPGRQDAARYGLDGGRAGQGAWPRPDLAHGVGLYRRRRHGLREVSEEVQAARLAGDIAWINGRKDIERAFIYTLVDYPGDGEYNRFGLFNEDGSPKPATDAVRAAIRGTRDPDARQCRNRLGARRPSRRHVADRRRGADHLDHRARSLAHRLPPRRAAGIPAADARGVPCALESQRATDSRIPNN